MFEKKKNRLLLLGLYIIFNIISLVLFGMVFFTDIEVPITLPIIILITWAIAIGFLYCYKMTGFPTLKSTIVLFYNAITNILLYFMPLIFQYAGILSKNKILFAVPIINFLLSAFLLSYDFIKTYGKDKEVIRDMNFYLEDGKESHSTSMDEYIELSEDDSKYITEQEENTEEEYFEEIQVNEVFDEKLSSEEVSVDEADEEIISEEVPVDEADEEIISEEASVDEADEEIISEEISVDEADEEIISEEVSVDEADEIDVNEKDLDFYMEETTEPVLDEKDLDFYVEEED